MVTCYSETQSIIDFTLLVTSIKFIDNNTDVHTTSSKKNNRFVTLYCRTKIIIKNITFSSQRGFDWFYSRDDF